MPTTCRVRVRLAKEGVMPLETSDADAIGIHVIDVDDDDQNGDKLTPPRIASCALDVLHSSIAVEGIDELAYEVVIDGKVQAEDPMHEDYSLTPCGRYVGRMT